MQKLKACQPLLDMFKDTSNEKFNLFMYDPNEGMVFSLDSLKKNRTIHEKLFNELNIITKKLNSLNCNYSIDAKGNILLNCHDKEFRCDLQ